jgi:hypothetical protein
MSITPATADKIRAALVSLNLIDPKAGSLDKTQSIVSPDKSKWPTSKFNADLDLSMLCGKILDKSVCFEDDEEWDPLTILDKIKLAN